MNVSALLKSIRRKEILALPLALIATLQIVIGAYRVRILIFVSHNVSYVMFNQDIVNEFWKWFQLTHL